MVELETVEVGVGERGALGELLRAAIRELADDHAADTRERVALDDAHLVGQVGLEAAQLVVDDRLRALVALDAFAGEDLHVDDGADHARGHAQRGVLNVRGLLAEDRAQQLLFGGELGLALGRDLAHEHVARLDLGADVHDARLVQARQLRLTQRRDVAGDLLGPELGVTGDDGELLDVDRGEAVVGDHAFGDEDRVFEVVAVPGHEADQHVLAQSQFAEVGGGAVGHHVALGDQVAHLHHRTLVDVGVLVRTGVLDHVVDVDTNFARQGFVVVDPDHDPVRIHIVHDAATGGLHGGTRVDRNAALDAGADQRLLRPQAGHGLALHVGAHQRTVGVVVLEEGDQRGRDRHDLARRHVHVLHHVRGGEQEFALVAARHEVAGEHARVVDLGVRLRDHVLAFLDRRQVVDLIGDLAVIDLAVRRLEEAVAVGARIHRERVDEADVRTFRGLDRAHAAVVRRVHVAHLEAGALAGQTARAEGRDATLVRDLGQRVGLVHELRQLAGAEELLDRGRDRLGVDQVVRHQVVGLGLRQALLDRALDTHQAGTELVLGELAHRTHAAVAEVVDVVDFAAAVAQLDQHADHREDVVVGQHARAILALCADALVEALEPGRRLVVDLLGIGTAVELHAADRRQVVALLGVEQAVEEAFDGVFGGRLARTHHAVDRDLGRPLIGGLVDAQGLRDVAAAIEVVDVQRAQLGDVGQAQLVEQILGDLVVGAREHLAGLGIGDVVGDHAAEDEVVRHGHGLDAGLVDLADVLGGDALVARDDDLAVGGGDVEARHLATQALGHELELRAFTLQVEGVGVVEGRQDLFRRQADRAQQDRDRHLAATVHAEVEVVLRVELEVQPRTAVGDDPRREQQLARRVRLAAVVLEEHARRTVQLRDDDALGAVDDEGAGGGHERNLAHVDFLLLDFLDGFLRRFAVHDDQAHARAQRRGEGQAALLALLHVERGLAQHVLDVFETRVAAVARDREDRGERGLQTLVPPRFGRGFRLQEFSEGLDLGGEQERRIEHGRALGEALADTFLFGVGIRHGCSG